MNPLQIGILILTLVIAGVLINMAVLIGGVTDANTVQIFNSLNLTNTVWDQLRQTTTSYTTQGIRISLVALILIALTIILSVIFVFAGGIGNTARRAGIAQFVEIWVARFRNVVVFVCRIGNYVVAAAARIGNIFVQATAI